MSTSGVSSPYVHACAGQLSVGLLTILLASPAEPPRDAVASNG